MTNTERKLTHDDRVSIETYTQGILAEVATIRTAQTLGEFADMLSDLEAAWAHASKGLDALYETIDEAAEKEAKR